MATEKKKTKEGTKTKNSPKTEAKKKGKASKKEKAPKVTTKDLEAQVAAEKDRVLRLSAEFENYKKRKQRELDEFKKFANETVFKQLLTVVDNLERAIISAEGDGTNESLLDGVKLTHKDIMKLFETFNVKPVDAENQPFDPNFHQAVNQEETDQFPDNTVMSVLQKGYTLHDRLIRPAMVIVSKRVEKETEKTKEK